MPADRKSEMKTVEADCDHPLFTWVDSCFKIEGIMKLAYMHNFSSVPETVSYLDLCNGTMLNCFLFYIYPEFDLGRVVAQVSDAIGRLKNLRFLSSNLLTFYKEILKQCIVMPLPDMLSIAKNPYPEVSGDDMKKLLLLLLGSAVQSEKKEEFVNQIKNLDVNLQHSIVEEIRKVTQDTDYVISVQQQMAASSDALMSTGVDGGDGARDATRALLHNLVRLVDERNSYAHLVLELNQEQESDSSSIQSVCSALKLPESQQHETCMRDDCAERHAGIEVADLKAKLRRMRQDLEEKIEIIVMHKEDIAEKDEIIMKLRKENLELTKEMRASKDYRDEMDMLREKADGVDRLEKECQKYKEKLMEMNFYRSRVEELREENHVLIETKNMLEDQISNLRQRVLQSSTCEAEALRLQRIISNLQQDMKLEHERMENVLDDNSRLQKELRENIKKAFDLEKEVERLKSPLESPVVVDDGVGRSLSDQLNDSLTSKLLRLELENQKLQGKLDEGKEQQSSMVTVYKAENDELHQAVQSLREQNAKDAAEVAKQQENSLQLVQTVNRLEKELQSRDEQHRFDVEKLKAELAQTASDQASSNEAALAQIKSEMESAKAQVADFVEHNEQLISKNKSLESEVARLKMEVNELHDQLNVVVSEKSTLEERLSSLDRENRCLEKENSKFKHLLQCSDAESETRRSRIAELERRAENLSTLQTECAELKRANLDAETEKKTACQQLDIERRKTSALSDDLVSEKRRCRLLEDHVRYVRSCLSMEPASTRTLASANDGNGAEDFDRFKEGVARCVADMRNQIIALQTQCLQKDKELEQQQKVNTDTIDHADHLPPELTNKNFLLVEENRNVRHQVFILQDQIKRSQDDIRNVRNENALLRQEIRDLQIQLSGSRMAQSENANLQVEIRTLRLNYDVIKEDNVELQKQCNQWETSNSLLRKSYEELQRQHHSLLKDHEQLQNLHEMLNVDFEKLSSEAAHLKAELRRTRQECNSRFERLMSEEQASSSEPAKRYEQDQYDKAKDSLKLFAVLQNEHSSLRKAHDNLKLLYEMSTRELDKLRAEYRALKSDFNVANLKVTQVRGELSDCQDGLRQRELEVTKLEHKCEVLSQVNRTLEDEGKMLLKQIDALIAQNQQLLHQSLADKDQYHAEERHLQERLNEMKRHKEKLEEKIMEHYKAMDSPTKKKDKTTLVKRVKAFIPRTSSSNKSRSKSHDSSSPDDSAMSAEEMNGFRDDSSRGTITDDTLTRSATSQHHRKIRSSSVKADAHRVRSRSLASCAINSMASSMDGINTFDHISLAGSERAVDVPNDPYLSSDRRFGQASRSPPPYVPRNRSVVRSCMYTKAEAAAVRRNLAATCSSFSRRLPPYPGNPSAARSPPPLPPRLVGSSFMRPPSSKLPPKVFPANLERFRPDLAEDELQHEVRCVMDTHSSVGVEREILRSSSPVDHSPTTAFKPQQASTPKSDESFTSSSAVLHPGNNSLVSSSATSASSRSSGAAVGPVAGDKLSDAGTSVSLRSAGAKRRNAVPSYYENVHSAAEPAAEFSPEDTLTEVLRECEHNKENTIWYEYGCV